MIMKKEFGRRLRELRKQRDLTQEKLAELIDIKPENYCRIENGLSFPKPENIEKLSKVLQVEIYELFTFKNSFQIEEIKQRLVNKLLTDSETTLIAYELLKSIGKI